MQSVLLRLFVGGLILGAGYVSGLVMRPLPPVPRPNVSAQPREILHGPRAADLATPSPAVMPAPVKPSVPKPATTWPLTDVAKLLANEKDLRKSMLNMATTIADALLPDDVTERWIATLPEGPQRNTAAMSYALKFMTSHPDRAQRMADLVTDAIEQRKLSSALAAQLAMHDPKAAMNYASAMPDPKARERARRTVLSVWSRQNPRGVFDALTAPGAEWSTEELVVPLYAIIPWLGAEVVQYALSMKDAAARQQWLSRGIWGWASQDPQAAAQWAHHLSPGEDRDTAISQIVNAASDDDPVQSVRWAQGISDENERLRSMQNAFTAWLKQSPSAAESWAKQQTDATTLKAITAAQKNATHVSGWSSRIVNGITLYEMH